MLTSRIHAGQHLRLARREIRDALWVAAAAPRPQAIDKVYATCNAVSVRQRLTLAVQGLHHLAGCTLVLSLGALLSRFGHVQLLPVGWADHAVLMACRSIDSAAILGDVSLCGKDGVFGDDGMGWRGGLRGFGQQEGAKSWIMEVFDGVRELSAQVLGLDLDGSESGTGEGGQQETEQASLTSPLVLRSALSFLLWWVCTAWFFGSLLGLFYWEIRQVTVEVQSEEATEDAAAANTDSDPTKTAEDSASGGDSTKKGSQTASPANKGK